MQPGPGVQLAAREWGQLFAVAGLSTCIRQRHGAGLHHVVHEGPRHGDALLFCRLHLLPGGQQPFRTIPPVNPTCRATVLQVGTGRPPAACDAAAAREPLRQAVAAWRADAHGPSKLCIMLEHQYTEASSMHQYTEVDSMLEVDLIRAQWLCQAVPHAGAPVHRGGLPGFVNSMWGRGQAYVVMCNAL